MVTFHSISMWLKENGYRYYLGDATGSGFIGYLWQTLWGYGDYEPDFRIEAEEQAYNDLVQFIRQHWMFREIQGEPGLEEDHFKIKCVDILSTRIHFSIKENQIVNGFYEKVVDAAYADTVIA